MGILIQLSYNCLKKNLHRRFATFDALFRASLFLPSSFADQLQNDHFWNSDLYWLFIGCVGITLNNNSNDVKCLFTDFLVTTMDFGKFGERRFGQQLSFMVIKYNGRNLWNFFNEPPHLFSETNGFAWIKIVRTFLWRIMTVNPGVYIKKRFSSTLKKILLVSFPEQCFGELSIITYNHFRSHFLKNQQFKFF